MTGAATVIRWSTAATGMWKENDVVKRTMVRAVKDAWGMILASVDGGWGIKIGTDFKDNSKANGIVDLGNGLCFRREAA